MEVILSGHAVYSGLQVMLSWLLADGRPRPIPLVKHEYPWVYFLAHLQLIHSFSERQTETSAVATVLCSGHNISSSAPQFIRYLFEPLIAQSNT